MRRIGQFAGIVLVAVSLTACGGGGTTGAQVDAGAPPAPSSAAAAPADVWSEDTAAAPSAGAVGTPQACPMPFSFDLAEGWQATAGDGETRDGLAATCRITDPKGSAGYVRVWVGAEPGSSPRGALERFLQGEGAISDPQYRESTVGRGTGVELSYAKESAQPLRGRAFAVATPLRTIVVAAGADTAVEFDRVLPGYLLAKDTLTPVER